MDDNEISRVLKKADKAIKKAKEEIYKNSTRPVSDCCQGQVKKRERKNICAICGKHCKVIRIPKRRKK